LPGSVRHRRSLHFDAETLVPVVPGADASE